MITTIYNPLSSSIKHIFNLIKITTALVILVFNTSCGSSSSDSTQKYSVGGEIIGLSGMGLVLQNNDTDDLPINDNGSYTFSSTLADGSTYAVTVNNNPATPIQVCTVSDSSGVINGNNITNADVFCQATSTGGSCITGSIDYNHSLESDISGVYQTFNITGNIPFTCDMNNNITGIGSLSMGVSGFIQTACSDCIWSTTATIDVDLGGSLANSEFRIDFDETWYAGSPTGSGTCTNTCGSGSTTFNYPYIETLIQHTEIFPDFYGHTITSPYIGSGGTFSGSYNYTIYTD